MPKREEREGRRKERAPQYRSPSYLNLLDRLAASLRHARTDADWSQEEAAARCGIALQHYQRIEAATENVTMTTVARLVDGFGLDVLFLFAELRGQHSKAAESETTYGKRPRRKR